jgi:hypothetical protein
MKHFILTLTAILFISGLTPVMGQTTKYFGEQVPNKLSANGTELTLNGAGLREKLWLDLYVGSLFLETKSSDAKKVITADAPMAIRLQIVSGLITSDKMIDACKEGFQKSAKDGYTTSQAKKDQFINVFKMDEIVDGNNYNLVYTPGTGVQVYLDNKLKDTIAGLDFKKALFGIWFCSEPADEDLMEGMLGLD